MNQQDKSFVTPFVTVMAGLVIIAAVLFLVSRLVSVVSVAPGDGTREAVILERIKPVATALVASAPLEGAAPVQMSAEEIVTSVCASCHTAGVLGAPKIGSNEDWGPRFEQGLDTLVTHAVNGIRSMPPKGGNPALSDEDIRTAVVYMLGESGIEAGADAGGEATAAAPEAAPAGAPGGADLAAGEQVYVGACFACHDTGAAGAPKKGDMAAWDVRAQQGMDTLVDHAVNGFNAMPAKGGNPNLSDEDVRNAVAFILQETGVAVGGGAATESTEPAQKEVPAAGETAQPEALEEAGAEAAAAEEAAAAAKDAAAAAEEAAAAAEEAATAAEKAVSSQGG